jgi:hypothetical protein
MSWIGVSSQGGLAWWNFFSTTSHHPFRDGFSFFLYYPIPKSVISGASKSVFP